MATTLEDSSMLEQELKCPVCLDLYREPHLLPCGHNFCLQCLQGLKSRSEGGRLCCPECRERHPCSTQWQKNFKLASIADSFRAHRSRAQWSSQSRPGPSHRTTEVRCDYCGPDITGNSAKRSTAVKTCLKCEVSMCPEHLQHHLELPAFREHPLVELSYMRKRKCTDHDEMFRYYCMDERKFLCNACTIEGGHSGHAVKTLKNTMKDLQASLNTQMQKVDREIRRIEKNVQEQREMEQQNKAFLEGVDKQVDTLRGVLMTSLDGFLSSLSESVCAYEGENSLNVQQNLVRADEDRDRLEVVRTGIEQLLQENDPFQFIKEYMSHAKSYRNLLKRPLFQPDAVTMVTEVIEERMEEKLEDFMTDLREHITTFINTVCALEEGDEEEEEEEEDYSDQNEDTNDSSDEDVDQEGGMIEDGELEDDHRESVYDYSPEDEVEIEWC